MKILLVFATICVFGFSTISGASIHTLAQLKVENGMMAVKLRTMTLRQLAEVPI